MFLVKSESSFDKNKLEKSRMEKTPVLKKKRKFGYSVLGMRKHNFRTKTFILKSLTMPRTVKGGSFGISNIHSIAKHQKKLRGPLETLKISKQSPTKLKKWGRSHSAKKWKGGQ